jgi:hypothetical protein
MTALAWASSRFKRQNRPLVRESAPHQHALNCLDNNKNLIVSPRSVLYSKTAGRLTVGRNIRLRLRTENIRGLNLAVFKLTTVEVTKLPL